MQHSNKAGDAAQRVLGRILAQNLDAAEQRAMQAAAGAIGPTNPASTAHVIKTAPMYFTDSITNDAGVPIR